MSLAVPRVALVRRKNYLESFWLGLAGRYRCLEKTVELADEQDGSAGSRSKQRKRMEQTMRKTDESSAQES